MRASGRCFLALLLTSFFACAHGQAVLSAQSDRVALHPDLSAMTRLSGHLPLWARAEADLGSLPDATPLRVTLVLSRSPERQAAFTRLLADQQNPASTSYHRWLTPQQVGENYGPTQHDLDTLSAWLVSRGLTVDEITPSRVFVHASAPAVTLAAAFSTPLHNFQVGDQIRRALTVEPAIPTAFVTLVSSVTGMADIPLDPMHGRGSMPTPQSTGLRPQDTFNSTTHFVTPGDFAVMFNLKPSYNAGYNGAGQKVAIIGRSRVASSDISLFQANTGLPVNLPNTIVPPAGTDPGVTGNSDQSEATLDLDRLLATAPGVRADLVVSAAAGGFNGIYIAAQYEVQTLLDPVMNISFGSCEVYAGPAQVNLWDTLFAQAASEGISVFVSASDSGAATCDAQFALVPDFQFRSINYICASSFATCVGGTELVDTNTTQYWSSTNTAGLVSALSYIPEGAWNEPGTIGAYYTVAAGGGGASIYVPKPSWQTGTGVPADGARDVPDISFPAAAHDGYYACYAAGGGDCAANRFEYFYGTSAAAPTMAGITALLNEKTGRSQGNLNPLLYRTAAASPSAFHDATPATSGVPNCSTATASLCNNSTPGTVSLTGGLAGFPLTIGYDQATGLGSLDVANFLNAASAPVAPLAAGKLTLVASASTIAHAQTATFTATFASTASGTPSGTVQFYANAAPLGAPVALVANTAITPALPFAAAGNYDITAVYSGDATFAKATAPGIALTVTGIASTPKFVFQPNILGTDPTVIVVGSSATFGVTIPAAAGSPVPTGLVRIGSSGPSSGYLATEPLIDGRAGTSSIYFNTVGSYTLVAYYLGDSVYSPSSSAPLPFTVQRVPPVATVSTTGGSVGSGGYQQFYVALSQTADSSQAAAPTGTFQLYANGAALGAPFPLLAGQAAQTASSAELFATPGSYTVTAVYSGDADWQPATSNALTQTVLPTPAADTRTPATT